MSSVSTTETLQVRRTIGARKFCRLSRKAIPIDETTAEAITEQKRLFRVKFGREPGADDPLFFNPDSAVPEFLGGEALEEIWRPARLTEAGRAFVQEARYALLHADRAIHLARVT